MMKNGSPGWVLGGWLTVIAAIVAWSVSLDARLSTSVLLALIGLAPVVVMVLVVAGGAPSATIAEILHSVHEDSRS
jgi:O-antigen ligase